MFERIEYKTNHESKSKEKLEALIKKGDVNAKIEFVLRSQFGGDVRKKEVSDSEANEVALEHLKKNPDHPLFNFIAGTYCKTHGWGKDYKGAHAYYLKALESAPGYLLSTLAREMTQVVFYVNANKIQGYIANYAWFAKSITQGSLLSEKSFVDASRVHLDTLLPEKSDTKSMWALWECTFLSIILSGKNFPGFEYSEWIRKWEDSLRPRFLAANNSKNPIADLDNENSDVIFIVNDAIRNDAELFLQYLKYCHENKLITDELYAKLMNIFIRKAMDSTLEDDANYDMFVYFANKKDDQAGKHLQKISANFTGYNKDDFASLPVEQQFATLYAIFKKLYADGSYDQAIKILNGINKLKTCKGYDMDAFKVFDKADRDAKNFEYFIVRRELCYKIIKHGRHLGIVLDRALSDYSELDKKSVKLRYSYRDCVRRLEEYLADREKRKKAEPNKNWGHEKERQDFVATMRDFLNDDMLSGAITDPTLEQLEAFHDKFYNAFFEGERQFWAGNIRDVIADIYKYLNKTKTSIPGPETGWKDRIASFEQLKLKPVTLDFSALYDVEKYSEQVSATVSVQSQPINLPTCVLVQDQYGRGYYMQELIDLATGAKVYYEPQSQQLFTTMLVPVEAQQAVFNTLVQHEWIRQQYLQASMQQQVMLQQSVDPQANAPAFTVQQPEQSQDVYNEQQMQGAYVTQQPAEPVYTQPDAAIMQQIFAVPGVQHVQPAPAVLQPEIAPATYNLLLGTLNAVPQVVAPPANTNAPVQQPQAQSAPAPQQRDRYAVPADALNTNGEVKGFEKAVIELMPKTKAPVLQNNFMKPQSVSDFSDLLFPAVPTKPVVKANEKKPADSNQKVAMPGQ